MLLFIAFKYQTMQWEYNWFDRRNQDFEAQQQKHDCKSIIAPAKGLVLLVTLISLKHHDVCSKV